MSDDNNQQSNDKGFALMIGAVVGAAAGFYGRLWGMKGTVIAGFVGGLGGFLGALGFTKLHKKYLESPSPQIITDPMARENRIALEAYQESNPDEFSKKYNAQMNPDKKAELKADWEARILKTMQEKTAADPVTSR